MRQPFPTWEEERALHERVLAGGSLASEAVFRAFMEPLSVRVRAEMGCDEETAYDAVVDAVFGYLNRPELYDPQRRLTTYLMRAAKNRVRDNRRTVGARAVREKNYATEFALSARNPQETLEDLTEAKRLMQWLVESKYLKNDQDWTAFEFFLLDERSTEALAKALGMPPDLPEKERRQEVKRIRDRLKKALARVLKKKKEEPDDES